jgi:membrane associated rhomboid family serine protease
MILLPIGHEESGVRRLPWVTFGLMAVCLLAFVASGRARLFVEDDLRVYEEANEALEYYIGHPYLELDAEFEELVFPDEESGAAELLEAYEISIPPPADEALLEEQQAELDDLVAAALDAVEDHTLFRWGLVPSDPSPVTLLTHMFLHGGWLHLLGNLLILYLAGPFIEDVWGRPFYLGFYVVAGLAAALAHIAFNSGSAVPMIGASGAIAGVMGAFLIRYRHTQIRFFYMVGLIWRGTFSAPAWLMLPMWFGEQLFFALLTAGQDGGGVAYWAHVGGFAFGAGGALAVANWKVEERILAPGIEQKITTEVVHNPAVERALAEQDAGRPEAAFDGLASEVAAAPDNQDAALAFWSIAVELGREIEAAPAMLRAIRRELRGGRADVALEHWNELSGRLPDQPVDFGTLLHVARALTKAGRSGEAAGLLRRALLEAGADPSGMLALRVARIAERVDTRLARGAARLALAQPEPSAAARAEARSMLARTEELPAAIVAPGASIPVADASSTTER